MFVFGYPFVHLFINLSIVQHFINPAFMSFVNKCYPYSHFTWPVRSPKYALKSAVSFNGDDLVLQSINLAIFTSALPVKSISE